MLAPVMLTIPALVLPLMTPPTRDCQFGRMGDPAADQQALVAFQAAITDYVDLQRRLRRAWPAAWLSADPENREFAAEQLRRALTDARPYAAQGALFTPEAADVFRFRIATALREGNYETATIESLLTRASGEGGWKPAVNEPLPWGTAGTSWPVAAAVAPLPPELEYRVIGRDLALLDIHANLVVDTIDLALPGLAAPTTGREEGAPAETDTPDCLDELPPDWSNLEESLSVTE